jgi:hypothetical protein
MNWFRGCAGLLHAFVTSSVDGHSVHGYPGRRHDPSIKDSDVIHKAVMALLISRVAPECVRSPWAALSVLH